MRPGEQHKELVDRIMGVLNHFDLTSVSPGAPGGAPLDEFELESEQIAAVLREHGAITAVEFLDIWRGWYGDDTDELASEQVQEVVDWLNRAAQAEVESPPITRKPGLDRPYEMEIPFATPPTETVEIDGEVPWELRD
jgi:hypothetical protein